MWGQDMDFREIIRFYFTEKTGVRGGFFQGKMEVVRGKVLGGSIGFLVK